jgi:hypothetical protein
MTNVDGRCTYLLMKQVQEAKNWREEEAGDS